MAINQPRTSVMKTSSAANIQYSVAESSSFEKVLTRLEKITERVNGDSGDTGNERDEERSDISNVKRDVSSDYREKLEALQRKVMKTGSSSTPINKRKKKTPRVRGTDFEVELVLSQSASTAHEETVKINPSKKAANDIIWRAYATTKSFGAIINGVVATQAVARRWLTVKKVRDEMNDRIRKVSLIKSVWKGYIWRKKFVKYVDDVIICQSQARRYIDTKKVEKLRHEIAAAKAIQRRLLEANMITTISSYWRRYYLQRLYKKKRAAIVKHEREMAASTAIQSKWRSHADTKTYSSIRCKVIALQCFVRQLIALNVMEQLLEEKRITEAKMTTKIATAWRRYHCQTVYRDDLRRIILCQSMVRSRAAIKELNALRLERDTASATIIEAEARCFLARTRLMRIKCSAILLQSLVRGMIAFEELEILREKRFMLETESATKITAVWRSYYLRTGYIIVLKAARKHERRYNAASIMQAQWRASARRDAFIQLKTNTIKIQSIIKMAQATAALKKKKMMIVEAANYHKDDYFAYSKVRKSAAVKIQAIYRMVMVRNEYTAKKLRWAKWQASNKIQSAYRKRYSARMRRATSQTELSDLQKPVFNDDTDNDDEEVDCIEYYQVAIAHGENASEAKDLFASAQQGQAASVGIQTVFQEHLSQSAKKTAYLAENAFELSKKRGEAAGKIQGAYRKHLFRTTIKFRPLPVEEPEESCTDIVPYKVITEVPTEFEIIPHGADILVMLMSMITG